MISLPSGGEVRLDDLGDVTDTVAERGTFARDVVVGKQCRRGSTS
jgi:hypothetical protein